MRDDYESQEEPIRLSREKTEKLVAIATKFLTTNEATSHYEATQVLNAVRLLTNQTNLNFKEQIETALELIKQHSLAATFTLSFSPSQAPKLTLNVQKEDNGK